MCSVRCTKGIGRILVPLSGANRIITPAAYSRRPSRAARALRGKNVDARRFPGNSLSPDLVHLSVSRVSRAISFFIELAPSSLFTSISFFFLFFLFFFFILCFSVFHGGHTNSAVISDHQRLDTLLTSEHVTHW